MAIIDKNTIKEWYRNLKKPPQEHFWNWLDSYWHKAELIAMASIDGLISALSKKADLVNGKVPEEQLPFTVSTSEVIAVGPITVSSDEVELAVHSSGNNTVRIGGVIYNRAFPNSWDFTLVADFVKILIIYAQVIGGDMNFYLAEGVESTEAVEPEIPAGALIVRRIVVTTDGTFIDSSQAAGYKEKSEEAWKSVSIPATGGWLQFSSDKASAFNVTPRNALEGVTASVYGIYTNVTDNNELWPGKTFLIRNNSVANLHLHTGWPPSTPTAVKILQFENNLNVTLKPFESAIVKVNQAGTALVVVTKMGGGSDFPTAGNNGDVLVKDNTLTDGVKWKMLYWSMLDGYVIRWDGTTSAFVPSGIYNSSAGNIGIGTTTPGEKLTVNGNVKADLFIYNVTTANTVPNKTWTDGKFLMFTDTLGVNKAVRTDSVFVYTPTGNFTISAIKTAVENAGLIFNDIHIIINIGSNNYTCSIDNGASLPNIIFTIGKRGTGSINFTSVRTMYAYDSITIINGSEGSMGLVQMGTSADYINIKNI